MYLLEEIVTLHVTYSYLKEYLEVEYRMFFLEEEYVQVFLLTHELA